MGSTWAICKKELVLYFYAPTSWIAFAFYFLLAGYFFSGGFLGSGVIDIRGLFGTITVLYIFIIPLLTMRLVSDELRQGTDELLLTSPTGIGEIIGGKYLAAIAVQLLLVVGSLLYPLIMSSYGHVNQMLLWMSYLSIFLLGATMMAVGLFASSLTANQMVAGISGFVFMLVLWMIDLLGANTSGRIRDLIGEFSVIGRTANFQKGLFDLSDLLFYILFALLFIVLSIQVLQRKRWG